MVRFLRFSPLILGLAASLLIGAPAALGSARDVGAPPIVSRAEVGSQAAPRPGRVVFKLREGLNPGAARGILGRLGVRREQVLARSGLYVVTVDDPADAPALVTALQFSGLVESVAEDTLVQAFDTPDDPNFPRQWHLQDTTGGMWAQGAWDLVPGGATGVVVAVIDTGVAFETHTDSGVFGPKRYVRAPDLAGVPIVAPWNFLNSTTHANDENGHGTHVAGTILQATDNGYGVAGVARGASLMPLKILDYSGSGSGADLVEAIYYAVDHGADVINMSLGFSGSGQPDENGAVCGEVPGLHDALDYAATHEVVVVAASGNDGAGVVACPAAHPTVIAVGATRYDGDVTFYSNQGFALDITAPGGDPNADQDHDGNPDGVLQETYCSDWLTLLFSGNFTDFCDVGMSGTSMASPHVAGSAALLLAVDPTLSALQVRFLLESTARDRGTPGRDDVYGNGALDARAAVASLLGGRPPEIAPTPYPSPTPYAVPAAPSGLTATAVSSGSIKLAWVDNATGEQGVRVERAAGDGPFVQVAQVSASVTTYTNRALDPETAYRFRVKAYDAAGYESAPSNEASATTFPVPAAPTGLTAGTITAWSIALAWSDNATTETGYRIEKSTDGLTWTFTGLVPANGTAFTATNLEPGAQHSFRVRATDGERFSEYSNTVSETTLPPPEAPSDLQVTGVTATSASLSWTDNSTTEQGFRIDRSTDGGMTYSQVAQLPANATSHTVLNLTPGTGYLFRVRSYAGSWSSLPSEPAAAVTQSPPAAPTNLAATPLTATQVRLTWTDNATTETGYRIEKSSDGSIFVLTGLLGADAATFTASGLSASTTYWFRVRAVDGTAASDYSEVVAGTTLGPPDAPSDLAASAITASSVTLAWVDNSTTEQGFRVERSNDGGTAFSTIASVGANTTSYKVTGLAAATTYSFRVRAYDGTAESANSSVLTVTTSSAPSAPGSLTATTLSATQIRLTWTDNSTTETGYRIERSADGTTWATAATLLANTTAYTNQSLTPSTTYWYRVFAVEGTQLSEPSNEATATTRDAPAAPSGLTATAMSSTSIKLTWTDNATTEQGFRIERSLDGGTTWVQVAIVGANATSWTNNGLTSGKTYVYRVRAYDGTANSDYCAAASATTP